MESESEYGVPIPGMVLPPEQWARTAIKKLPPPAPLDWPEVFGRSAPVVLDLGCGNGRFIVSSALERPECNFLGLDILPLVIRYATRRSNQRGLHHVRLAVCGGHEFLAQYVAPGSVAEIHLYHPQPYRDEERAYRRLITPEFLLLVHRSLAPGGMVVVQTDNRPYWEYMQQTMPALFEFTEHPQPWSDAPRGRTRREIYALQHRMQVFRGIGRRRDLSDEEAALLAAGLPRPQFEAGSTKRRRQRSRRPQGAPKKHRPQGGWKGRG